MKRKDEKPRKPQLKVVNDLSSETIVKGKAIELTPSATRKSEQVVSGNKYKSPRIIIGIDSGLPPRPPVTVKSPFEFAAGVYIAIGQTGVGKSVALASLVAEINSKKGNAAYLPVFEPRKLVTAPMFVNAEQFLHDIEKVTEPTGGLIVIDSITLPLKALASTKRSQATFAGGMQSSDREFLDSLSSIAVNKKCTFIAVVNTNLVPYAAQLAGATEGIITVTSIWSMEIADRQAKSSRQAVVLELDRATVDQTLTDFGYTQRAEGSSQPSQSYGRVSYIGFNLPTEPPSVEGGVLDSGSGI